VRQCGEIGRTGLDTDDNMAHALWVLDTYGYGYRHSQFVILIAFHCNSGCTNASQYYVVRSLVYLDLLMRIASVWLTETGVKLRTEYCTV